MIDRLIKFTTIIFFLLFPLYFLPLGNTSVDYDKQIILLVFSLLLFLLTAVKTINSKKITLVQTPFDGLLLLLSLVYLLSAFLISPNKMESLLSPMGGATILSLTLLYFSLTYYRFMESGKGDASGRASGSAHDRSTDGRETCGRTLTQIDTLIISAILLSIPILARQFNPNITIFPLGSYYSTALFLIPLLIYVIINLFHTLRENKKILKSIIFYLLSVITLVSSLALSVYHLFTDQKPILLAPTAGWAILLESYKNITHFLLGVGPNNFSSAYALGKPLLLNTTPFWNAISFMSSSFLFTAATEVGIFGLLVLLMFAVKIIKLWHTFILDTKQRGDTIWGTPNKRALRPQSQGALVGGKSGQDPFATELAAEPVNYTYYYLLPLTISFIILLLLPIQLPFLILAVVFLAAAAPQKIKQFTLPIAKKLTVYLTLILLITSALLLYWPLKSYASDVLLRLSLISNSNQFLGTALNFSQKAIEFNPYSERAYSLSNTLTLEALRNIAGQTNASDSAEITQSLAGQAITHARKTTELSPQKSENWGLLGDTYQSLSGIAENANTWALNAYNQQILLNPFSPQAKVSAGGLSMISGDHETAALLFRQAINLKPDWNNAHYNLAILYSKTGNYNYAIVELQKTLVYTPSDSQDYAQVSRDLQSLQNMFNQPSSASGEAK